MFIIGLICYCVLIVFIGNTIKKYIFDLNIVYKVLIIFIFTIIFYGLYIYFNFYFKNKNEISKWIFISLISIIFILFYIIIIFSLQKCNINLYPSYINELINKIPKHILYIIIIIYLICILCTIYYLYNLTYSNYLYYTDIWVFILIIEIFILIIILILKNCNNEYLNNLPIFNTFKNITNKMENLLRLNSYDDLKKK